MAKVRCFPRAVSPAAHALRAATLPPAKPRYELATPHVLPGSGRSIVRTSSSTTHSSSDFSPAINRENAVPGLRLARSEPSFELSGQTDQSPQFGVHRSCDGEWWLLLGTSDEWHRPIKRLSPRALPSMWVRYAFGPFRKRFIRAKESDLQVPSLRHRNRTPCGVQAIADDLYRSGPRIIMVKLTRSTQRKEE